MFHGLKLSLCNHFRLLELILNYTLMILFRYFRVQLLKYTNKTVMRFKIHLLGKEGIEEEKEKEEEEALTHHVLQSYAS